MLPCSLGERTGRRAFWTHDGKLWSGILGYEYGRAVFRRRRRERVFGLRVSVISPEDLILAKLRWGAESGSQRQLEDACGVAELQQGRLDFSYLRRWAAKLSLAAMLDRVLP